MFYLTLLQAAADQFHYPELSGESLRLEMFFFSVSFGASNRTDSLGRKTNNVYTDQIVTVAKNV